MASKPDTWMPFYVGDYLRKTMHLTIEQHGAYMLLIMACWVGGGAIADDDKQLAATVRVALPQWRRLRAKIAPFFQITDGHWNNKRVTEELTKVIDRTEQRRAAGEASAAKRQRDTQRKGNENVNETSTKPPTKPPTKRQRKGNDPFSPSPPLDSPLTPPTPTPPTPSALNPPVARGGLRRRRSPATNLFEGAYRAAEAISDRDEAAKPRDRGD